MFLSSTTAAEDDFSGPNKNASSDYMSLTDMKIQQDMRNDITLDYEQFAKIFTFERGRELNFKGMFSPPSQKSQSKKQGYMVG